MRAIVYHAYCRPKYIKMAIISAESAKLHMPDVETVLLTEMAVDRGFDRIVHVDPVPQALANLPPLLELPADYTSAISFGADSYICTPFYDVFELVENDHVDIAMVAIRHRDRPSHPESPDVPAAYPEHISGPAAFQNNTKMREFFALWSQLFRENQQKYHARMRNPPLCFQCQPSMRAALYHSNLIVATLPPKYHYISSQIIHGRVRAFHSKSADRKALAKMARSINRHPSELRFVHGRWGYLFSDIEFKKQ